MFRKFTLAVFTAMITMGAFAQQDSTTYDPALNDTMKIGSILIIKMNKPGDTAKKTTTIVRERWPEDKRFSTSWFVMDLGFSNWDDKTNYGNTGNFLLNGPGQQPLGKEDLGPRIGKSRNVNLWFVMQQMGLIKHNVSLKYGLGLELNNYHFKNNISFRENGKLPYTSGTTNAPFVFRDTIGFKKNKLAADYLTVPLMISFSDGRQNVYVSAGVSAGYLYSARNKQKSDERGKEKYKGDFDLKKFKYSYIGELGFDNFSIYGSYTPKSIFKNEMDMRSFNVGLRFNFL